MTTKEEKVQLLAKGVLELSRYCEQSTLEETAEYKKLKELTKLAGLLTSDIAEYNPTDDCEPFKGHKD